jgi:hypothetical protein
MVLFFNQERTIALSKKNGAASILKPGKEKGDTVISRIALFP